MSSKKKAIRQKFRDDVFSRDGYKCRICSSTDELDAHHITDRNELPDGGYIVQNGITLCKECHKQAEEFHRTGTSVDGFSPEDLYKKIGSSLEIVKQILRV